mmetsp:Transcript_27446/g.81356  ORF Transcript_27446/g.81356 Transcript_27446/m.81356 type:complete len:223 (-) Transcript_27446:109-777(-)
MLRAPLAVATRAAIPTPLPRRLRCVRPALAAALLSSLALSGPSPAATPAAPTAAAPSSAVVSVTGSGGGAIASQLRGSARPMMASSSARHLVATTETFRDELKVVGQGTPPRIVVFSADLDPETGEPWCPDCRLALPAIADMVEGRGGTWLEVRVGDKPTWKDPANPLRTDPALRITSIPTLFEVAHDGALGARNGHDVDDARTAEQMRAAVEGFVDGLAAQ